ncbi:hypothetical protein LAZ67_4004048 [Cordylochernes scorpioides]|uniref:Caveolin n=1 Tax=Cordylochernes scorpioides TaxID=51811 RepID=A0ABY6KH87_9ARAC|nr:hypothetical protein LAZ67_4004048 [Cordylochernes scorpioides]
MTRRQESGVIMGTNQDSPPYAGVQYKRAQKLDKGVVFRVTPLYVSVYDEGCMSIQMFRRWHSWFLEGRQNVHDDERSGRPVTATDNAAFAAVRNVVEADRRVTIDGIMIRMPPGIEIGRSSIGTIMSDVLNFRKVCERWVPRLLSENHKQQRMEAARAFLEMHRRDGDQLFSRIVTGDESWVHHSTLETKGQSMVWKKPEESAPKKAKVTISAGKVMAIVFWDCNGVLLVDYLPPNTTVNAARLTCVWQQLRNDLQSADIANKKPMDVLDVSYLQVEFDDIIAEPDDTHSVDCVWRGAHSVFTETKNCCYQVLSTLCALPIALLVGCCFACVSFQHIWCIGPAVRHCRIHCHAVRQYVNIILDSCLAPLCSVCGLCFSRVGRPLKSEII